MRYTCYSLAQLFYICLVLLCTLFNLPLPDATAAKSKPNVLFLFTDDQRADTIHALGNSVIQTPHLDQLVKTGFVMHNAYCMGSNVGAVCFPRRNMLLSGKAYFRFAKRKPAPRDKPNFPTSMKAAGYATYHHGKKGNTAREIHKAFDVSKYVNDFEDRTSGEPGKVIVRPDAVGICGSDVAYYLLAYLFDGSAFVPAAKTYLGGSAQSIEGSQIASIDDGAIRVRFDVAPSGDGVATGHETAAFVFQDGELTEAPTS